MLRVGERVLLLALSEERDKHPLGYLSSRLLADAEGRAGGLTSPALRIIFLSLSPETSTTYRLCMYKCWQFASFR